MRSGHNLPKEDCAPVIEVHLEFRQHFPSFCPCRIHKCFPTTDSGLRESRRSSERLIDRLCEGCRVQSERLAHYNKFIARLRQEEGRKNDVRTSNVKGSLSTTWNSSTCFPSNTYPKSRHGPATADRLSPRAQACPPALANWDPAPQK